MVWEADTRKKLEAAIEVVNDCFDALCKAETRDGVYGDLFDAWEYIDDAMRAYYNGLEHIDSVLSRTNKIEVQGLGRLESRIKRLEHLMKK